jgi:hypothetical protein
MLRWISVVTLNAGGHVPIGVTSVTHNATSVTLTFDFTATQIHTFVVTPDETYAVDGIFCGASVGFTTAVIKFGKDGALVNPGSAILQKASGNFWVWGLFTAD